MPKIGTLNEKSLHADLKKYCCKKGDKFEVSLEGFVIDIIRKDLLIEIQTRNFGAMKNKLSKLLPNHKIHLIHPIAINKWIIKQDPQNNKKEARRKSPKKGKKEHIFNELIYITHILNHPNLSLEVILIEEEEKRTYNHKKRHKRKKGWVTEERFLIQVVDTFIIKNVKDLLKLLPAEIPKHFTTTDIANRLKKDKKIAQKMAYTLNKIDLINKVGKKGNSILYEINI